MLLLYMREFVPNYKIELAAFQPLAVIVTYTNTTGQTAKSIGQVASAARNDINTAQPDAYSLSNNKGTFVEFTGVDSSKVKSLRRSKTQYRK